MKMSNNKSTGVEEAWDAALRWQLKVLDHEAKAAVAKKLLLAGIQERENKLVQNLSYALIDQFELVSPQELLEAEESALMRAADAYSERHRKFLKKQAAGGGKSAKKTVASASPTKKAAKKEEVKDDESKASSKTAKSKGTKKGAKRGSKKKK